MKNCANCGAPLENTNKCSYCKSLIDQTLNNINNMVFGHSYPLVSCMSTPAVSYYTDGSMLGLHGGMRHQ